ncbi:MAG: ATP-binding protein [Bilophila wadsworthia]
MPCGPGAARPPCGQASGRPGRQSEHSAPVSGCRRFRPHPSDAERLEGCLLNLVGNALEAFPAPGCAPARRSPVEIARTPDALIYDVRDNGTGLSAEAAERLGTVCYDQKDGTGFDCSERAKRF